MAIDQFVPGQCWMSESEPELGLGFVIDVNQQILTIRYPDARQDRRYGRRSAPLKRVTWQIGDRIQGRGGSPFLIEDIKNKDGLLWYFGEGQKLCEKDVSAKTRVAGPLSRMLSGQLDSPIAYELRRQTLENWSRASNSPVRGLLGPRVELIPHQVYVVSEVARRSLPRVLLADEVGLGKTIEAGWITHQLLVTGRMTRVLVLAPRSMVNQWFVEMHRRFNLTFRVPESETTEYAESAEAEITDHIAAHSQLILSIESLKDEDVCDAILQTRWDMIIVDEAHRIAWSEEAPSREYLIVEHLAKTSAGLLLLTATPEQLGIEGHFGRLHLLDAQRFSSYSAFLKEHERYAAVAKKAEKLIGDKSTDRTEELRDLVDRHGTGRIYFRNARKIVEAESYQFPKRLVKPHSLKSDDLRVSWLKNLLDEYPEDKFLLICNSRLKIERIDAELQALARVRTALFHEKQSLVVRDRSAAYFADPSGARILLSSEIGSEGRNFQFARHLILWDLPEDPDLLEQRIGRLDRIGQRREFFVHVPFVEGTEEELLFRWYNEVFEIFDTPATGAASIHSEFWPVSKKQFEASVKKARAIYLKEREALEKGRDRLIELNSFNSNTALARVEELQAEERSDDLQEYMDGVFSWVGVHEEDLDADSYFIEPGDAMFIPTFPGLPDDGLRITYQRQKSLEREDLTLLSWDHPMVRQVMETIVSQEFGNSCVARWKETGTRRPPLIECYYLLQCAAPAEWYSDEFFPPLPIRIVIDINGKNVTELWPSEKFNKEVSRTRVRPEEWERLGLRPHLKKLVDQSSATVQTRASQYGKEAMARMHAKVASEVDRLAALAEKNGLVSAREIDWWLKRKVALEEAFARVEWRLDAVRVVY